MFEFIMKRLIARRGINLVGHTRTFLTFDGVTYVELLEAPSFSTREYSPLELEQLRNSGEFRAEGAELVTLFVGATCSWIQEQHYVDPGSN